MGNKTCVGILTISDKGAQGLRSDESGAVLVRILEEKGYSVLKREIVPDDRRRIADKLSSWVDKDGLPLIVTSGGTGLSPTDVTPQAMKDIIDYEVPGMAEAMRAASLRKTPHAMISRAIVGVRKATLIINLPGSPRGAGENLSVVLPALNHALSKLAGDTSECAT
jgi:molybdenum cofactor synthesis domain-containing protein